MALSESRKHKMKIGGLLGLSIGIVAGSVFWIAGFGAGSLILVPIGVLIGVGQAYVSPDDTEEN